MTQGEQGKVVKRFREGVFNTIVATSIGEEGLDIGEVDLIVCFDAQLSPTRLVQRMGRTGTIPIFFSFFSYYILIYLFILLFLLFLFFLIQSPLQ